MSKPKRVVLDANILIRAVPGTQVRGLLNGYEDAAEFNTPDICLADAHKHSASISARKGVDPALAESVRNIITGGLIQVVARSLYEEFKERAQARISSRDPDDWPIVATALLLDAQSGPKTTTSLAMALPPGQATGSSCTCATRSCSRSSSQTTNFELAVTPQIGDAIKKKA